jgi:lysophospholipase L1-like esterase
MKRVRSARRLLLGLNLAALALIATCAARADEYKSPLVRMDLSEGDSVVFLGDSITHQCLYTQYVEDFYYTRYPGRKIRFHNAGVGGATARDALDRFDRDVAAYKPKYVTVLLGMNDGGYKPYDETTFQTYRTGMTELVSKIREIGAMPILMTPTMYDARAARLRGAKNPPLNIEMYNATLAYYGAWLRETAVEQGAGFVDMYSLLNNLTLRARETDPTFTLVKDAVHPDSPGQLVMAYALLHDLDAGQGGLFDLRTEVGPGNGVKVALKSGTGGSLSDPVSHPGSLEFTSVRTPFRSPFPPRPSPEPDWSISATRWAVGHFQWPGFHKDITS